ncbi:hypothetical protein [Microbacterium aurantiacum]|uniref:O-antigen polysaccharide polymerase Wzy n=1 Tax=Microbacterium aurantiacum TaxID=162393 RepID=A0ABT8FRP0_9MICO|nr:hypothetical protein [Microbacterium aurantiacum]MDN4463875.1 hypothetical protein [Microbacterium aurantiacum]
MTLARSTYKPDTQVVGVAALCVLASGLGLYALLSGRPDLGFHWMAALGILIALVVSRKRLAPLYLSPVAIVSIGIVGMALVGAAFYSSVQYAATGGSIRAILTDAETAATMTAMFVLAAAVLTGGLLVAWIAPRIEPTRQLSTEWQVSAGTLGLMVFAGFIPGLLIVVLRGSDLLRRNFYIEDHEAGSSILGLAGQLSIAAVIIMGYAFMRGRGGVRFLALLGGAGYLAIFFANGSRRLALWPILFALGMLIARRNRATITALVLSLPAAVGLVGIALFLRGLDQHGLVAYLERLPLLSAYPIDWSSVSRNVLISFGIIGATAFQQPQIDPGLFWVSVNPLPGGLVGWYGEAADLRLNYYTPYAAIGELANHGTLYLVGYGLIVGVILGGLDRSVQKLTKNGHDIFALALVGLSAMFLLLSMQYTLRASTRLLVYGVLIAIAVGWLSGVLARQRARRDAAPHWRR